MKKYYQILLVLIYTAPLTTFNSCTKKELPDPNYNNTITRTTDSEEYVPPCESTVTNNRITTTFPNSSDISYFISPKHYSSFDYQEIVCSHYSSTTRFEIRLPRIIDGFVGKLNYQVKDVYSPSSGVAIFMHKLSYYSTPYNGTSGTIYAEYTKDSYLILTFCDINAEYTGGSEEIISGKITVKLD